MSFKQFAPLLAAVVTAVFLCAVVGVIPLPTGGGEQENSQSVMAPAVSPKEAPSSATGETQQATLEALPVVNDAKDAEPTGPAGSAESSGPAAPTGQTAPTEDADGMTEPVPAATEPTEPPTEPPVQPYDFTQPAPEREAVEKSYFADAAFVGDSRTDGFMIYSGIGTGTNLTSNGLSIFRLESKKALKIAGEEYTLLEALALKEYGKVYLCLGVNELGIYNDEGFYQSYLSAIDAIRAAQPNAVIYIQGLIPLNEEERLAAEGKSDLTNEHLRVYNDLMRRAAEEKQVVYLDLYSEFADENGSLPAGASRDGVHLNKEYCQRWLAYLQTHTVDPEALGLGTTENEEVVAQ